MKLDYILREADKSIEKLTEKLAVSNNVDSLKNELKLGRYISSLSDEEIVNQMIKEGRMITDYIIEKYNPFLIIAGFSGGNDSIVSTHFTCTEYINQNPEVIYCNTGIGVEKTKEHIRNVCNKFNWKLNEYEAECFGKRAYKRVVINGKTIRQECDGSTLPLGRWVEAETAYEEFVYNFGFPGPPQHGRLFNRLKERPLQRYIRDIRKECDNYNDDIMIITGIRSDESSIRAGYKRCYRRDRRLIWVNPFYYNTKYHFELYRQEFGLPRNLVSDIIGFSGECLCGAFAKKGELLAVNQVDQEVVNRILTIQNKVKELGHERCKWGNQTNADIEDLQQTNNFTPMCVGCAFKK